MGVGGGEDKVTWWPGDKLHGMVVMVGSGRYVSNGG